MSDYCSACGALKEYAPNFMINGITDKECKSLQNDTGLNSDLKVLHNNCEDLNDLLDCLLGAHQDKLPAVASCDWKEYTDELMTNLQNMQKAMICSECGQWKKIHDLEEKVNELCMISNQLVKQQTDHYDFPKHYHLVNNGAHHPDRHAGINYKRIDTKNCDGTQVTIEWIAPTIVGYNVTNLSSGDVIASVDKKTAQSWGITENIWYQLTVYSASFSAGYFLGNGTFGRFLLDVSPERPNTLELIYLGASYPNTQNLSTSLSQDNPALRTFVTEY
ncbi:hypothetical protein [Candidatus Enterococcus ikei]|uniref:hypothetical protein n=1 Tax=Candidatus Enterococcus ikei TaxID=2815326 RepID=UPI001F5CB4A9|nr:hypothetical protein [Enterococcus sp. DIV0869a]